MHNFLVEMCRSCLKQDVPLFETMEGETNKKKVKNSTIIQDLFRKDIVEGYNWKLCETCTVLLKGAVLLEKALLSSKLHYNNYLRMFVGNNHLSRNTFSNLSVQIQDIIASAEKKDTVKVRYAMVEESTTYITDGCLKTEFLLDVDSHEDDVIETKMKIEIDDNMLNDFHCVEETLVNIKSDEENDNILGSTEENKEVEQLSNAALLASSSKLLQLIEESIMNADKDYNNETEAAKEEKKLLKCSICNRKFNKKQSLVAHLRAHCDMKSYKCDLCTTAFSPKSAYHSHRRIHTSEKPYKCDLCIKVFTNKSNCDTHRRIHTGKKPYKCDLCIKAFSHKSACYRHRLIHTGEKPYKCDFCIKAFSNKSNYDRHRQIHTGEKPYKCDLCIKVFTNKSNCDTHRRIHTGEKPYKCDLCIKAFSNKSNYDRHRQIHTGEKPYKCDLCIKAFSGKSNYDQHRRHHTGEKQYKCDLCIKSFSNKSHYDRHRRVHTGEKPYKCDLCVKSFSNKFNCQQHRQIHTGKKPYKCDLCSKSFTRNSYYNKHLCKI